MENKVCKSVLKVGDDFPIAEIFFLEKDLSHLGSLLGSLYHKFKLVSVPCESDEFHPHAEPKLFCKTNVFQFVYNTFNYQTTSPSERLIRKLEMENFYQEIHNCPDVHDLLINGSQFFTNKLLQEPVYSFKVKAISEMERIEKLLKEADLQLSPEQEVKLLRKIVEEQQVVINNLKGI